MDIEQLQKEAHACAIEKGWHESDELGPDGEPTPRQRLAWLALVTTELDEASLEDARKGIYYHQTSCGNKPEGKAVEYADARIRILDAMGAIRFTAIDVAVSPLDSIDAARLELAEAIRSGRDDAFAWSALDAVIARRAIFDVGLGELDRAMRAKMTYNRTRPWRHNGKLA